MKKYLIITISMLTFLFTINILHKSNDDLDLSEFESMNIKEALEQLNKLKPITTNTD
jgi:hypothetical protein